MHRLTWDPRNIMEVACMREEKFYPNIFDLSYITNHSSSQEQIIGMQDKIFGQFKDNLEHPNPATYLDRFLKAAKPSREESASVSLLWKHFKHAKIQTLEI